MIDLDDGDIMQELQPQIPAVEARPQNNYLLCTSSGSLFQQIVDETGPCQSGSQRAGDPALDKMIE